jgi:inosine/xanthosine triphosphate pyrophosphatase family protein
MKPSVLFGTASRAKLDHVRSLVDELPVHVLSPADLGLNLHVDEHGDTAEANALIKASAYCHAANIPAFAIDAGLTIDALPRHEQPGVYVRRIRRDHEQHSDAAILNHYSALMHRVGGESVGRWHVSIALAQPENRSVQVSYLIETRFSARPSAVRIDDAPLSSLMLDPSSGAYYSEMAYADRPDSVQLKQSLLSLFEQLPSPADDRAASNR